MAPPPLTCETRHQPTLDQPEQPDATVRARWHDPVDDRVIGEAVLCQPCADLLARPFARQSKPLYRKEQP